MPLKLHQADATPDDGDLDAINPDAAHWSDDRDEAVEAADQERFVAGLEQEATERMNRNLRAFDELVEHGASPEEIFSEEFECRR